MPINIVTWLCTKFSYISAWLSYQCQNYLFTNINIILIVILLGLIHVASGPPLTSKDIFEDQWQSNFQSQLDTFLMLNKQSKKQWRHKIFTKLKLHCQQYQVLLQITVFLNSVLHQFFNVLCFILPMFLCSLLGHCLITQLPTANLLFRQTPVDAARVWPLASVSCSCWFIFKLLPVTNYTACSQKQWDANNWQRLLCSNILVGSRICASVNRSPMSSYYYYYLNRTIGTNTIA